MTSVDSAVTPIDETGEASGDRSPPLRAYRSKAKAGPERGPTVAEPAHPRPGRGLQQQGAIA
jgi:hypothetical protein